MSFNETKQRRIDEVKRQVESTPELKKMVDNNQEYVEKIKNYSFDDLMNELQPKWTNQRFLNEKEATEFALLIIEYRMRGLDMEYFTSGAGSYITAKKGMDCIIL